MTHLLIRPRSSHLTIKLMKTSDMKLDRRSSAVCPPHSISSASDFLSLNGHNVPERLDILRVAFRQNRFDRTLVDILPNADRQDSSAG